MFGFLLSPSFIDELQMFTLELDVAKILIINSKPHALQSSPFVPATHDFKRKEIKQGCKREGQRGKSAPTASLFRGSAMFEMQQIAFHMLK